VRHRSSLAAALLVVFAAGLSASRGQTTSPRNAPAAPEPALSPASEPRTVRVEAIVTDKHGKPILNLRPSDFSIAENGVAQRIDSVVLTSKAALVSAPAPVESSGDLERAAKEPGTRIIALYLDEFHVSAGVSTDRVRQAAARFIEEQLRPADLLVVMKPLDPVTDIRFTRDRGAARTAVASFEGRREDFAPRTAFEEQYLGRAPGAVRSARAQIVMSGLRALAARIGELDGGLAGIVLVTEGFSAQVSRSRERRLPDMQSIVRATSRSRVLLYAFDPGEPAAVPSASTGAPGAAPVADAAGSPTALQTLARETGGEAVPAGDDLLAGLQRVSRDLDTYYVLSYRSRSSSDGRFHNLRISSSRAGAHVRARSGYWAALPTEVRAIRAMPALMLPTRAIRRSPLIEVWFGTTVESDGRLRAIFTWTPAPPSARAKPAPRPEVVALKVSTVAGKVLFEGEISPARTGGPSQMADSASFDATPGRLQFDFTVLRADGSKLDAGAQDFDVPEMPAGPPVILQPQLLLAASAREFREISNDPRAAPLPTREFRRTERLLMRVPTYDPAGSDVQVSAKLINRVGAVLIELEPSSQVPDSTIRQFDLPLARFAPGEYSLEVAARSESGSARQLIRFRITG
jgi:VWFA-related protein